jgi:uncharacterized DUF497 family protein
MRVRFFFDPDTDSPHIHKHGVSEQEVEDILRLPLEEGRGRRGARTAIGQTRAGRHLKVIYVPDRFRDGLFVITAYDLGAKALAAFRRRMRNRHR